MKGYKKCCISNEVDRTGDDMLWNGSQEDIGKLGVSVRKRKALTVKRETVTLIGRCR